MNIKEKIKEIKAIVFNSNVTEVNEIEEVEVKFKDVKVMDGSILIRVEGEEILEGLVAKEISEDGSLTILTEGSYELEDGSILTIKEEGIIEAIEVKEIEDENTEEVEEVVVEAEVELETEVVENEEVIAEVVVENEEVENTLEDVKLTELEEMILSIISKQEQFSKAQEMMFSIIEELGNAPINETMTDVEKFSSYKKEIKDKRFSKIDMIANIKNKNKK